MAITIDSVLKKIEKKALTQQDFEDFVCGCESDEDFKCFLGCALDNGLKIDQEGSLEDIATELENLGYKDGFETINDGYYNESNIEQYFHEIGEYDPIPEEEEDEIIKAAKEGDEEARDRLVTANLKLVARVALKYSRTNTNYIDLIQDGTIGLISAIDKYDFEKGYNFSAYAIWWIKKEIINAISNKMKSIKVPNYIYLQNKKIKIYEDEFFNTNGRVPTYDEIALELEMTKDEVEKLKESADIGVGGFGEGSEAYLKDYNTVEEIERDLNLLEEKTMVSNLLKKVSPIEKKIIELFFGLDTERKSIGEIAKILKVSPDKVKLVKDRTLKKLKYAEERTWI